VTDGFAKLCENPRIMELMAQIEANITELEDEHGPWLYRCPDCLDRGVALIVTDTIATGRPCTWCAMGVGIERQRARDRFHGQRQTATANRKLTDVERHRALNGDYSFLDSEA